MFYVSRGGSRGAPCLTELGAAMIPGVSAKERPSRAWGEGEGEEGAGIIMSSNDVGSYDLKRSPSEVQKEERSAPLARSTSDGSADIFIADSFLFISSCRARPRRGGEVEDRRDAVPDHRQSTFKRTRGQTNVRVLLCHVQKPMNSSGNPFIST